MNLIRYQQEERIAFIQINRPEKRNSLNNEVVKELKSAFLKAISSEQVKVIVLKGTGEVFCSGADLAYLEKLQTFNKEENQKDSRDLMELFKMIYECAKPVIAQVNGHALAGGCGLVSVCDFAITVPEVKFGYTEVRIGFIPAIVMSFLIRKIGESRARFLLLSGKLIESEQALKYGLVHDVVNEDDLDTAVKDFAEALCIQNSGEAMRMTKQLINSIQDLSLEEALELAVEKNAEARSTMDCKKGISSFLQKKKIEW